MNLPLTYAALASALSLFLGYLLWTARPSRQRRAASLLLTSLLLWLTGELLAAIAGDAQSALLAIRFTYGVIACVPLALHHLIASFDDPRAARHRAARSSLTVFASRSSSTWRWPCTPRSGAAIGARERTPPPCSPRWWWARSWAWSICSSCSRSACTCSASRWRRSS
jgi:hypothetical protein